jgi:hypothetical protein
MMHLLVASILLLNKLGGRNRQRGTFCIITMVATTVQATPVQIMHSDFISGPLAGFGNLRVPD